MEIEAKFTIPDQDTIERLKSIVRLGPFAFAPGPPDLQHVLDHYLDTTEQLLYQNRYACRIRDQDKRRTLTVKGFGDVNDAIHHRFESEFEFPAQDGDENDVGYGSERPINPQTWPESEARQLILELAKTQPLHELFSIEQDRLVRDLVHDGHPIAQLSIDQAKIEAQQKHQSFWVLEIELTANGTVEHLRLLSDHLMKTWRLQAEHHSKFDLGMALLTQTGTEDWPGPNALSSAERAQLALIVQRVDDSILQDRARLILEQENDGSIRKLAERLGRSKSWAYEWIARFRAERMGIFPSALLALEPDQEGAELQTKPSAFLTDLPDEAHPRREGMSIDAMCHHFQVDFAHARRVADHAVTLFDALTSAHRLGADHRQLLGIMGLLHNVGLETDPDRHHIAGCDIIMANPLRELNEIEQQMLAAAVYLHRKKIKPKRLRAKPVKMLPPGVQEDTLTLAALLRMADGLDYSQTQTTVLDQIETASRPNRVIVSGPNARVDAARAESKADLWEHLFGTALAFLTQETVSAASVASSLEEPDSSSPIPGSGIADQEKQPDRPDLWRSQDLTSPGILSDEPMSEAGRKILYFHFLRMLENQAGTREGQDIEALHDMRVATRRMRSALQLFAPYYKREAIRPYVLGLRRTARSLGEVRDLDVFMERAQQYLATLPPENANDLAPLLELWHRQREKARKKMIAYLDDEKYQDFMRDFHRFLTTPGASARKMKGFPPKPLLVRHIVPRLIYTRLEQVLAFEPILTDAPISVLHALRIDCKRLRYTLEFFVEVLGTEAKQVIERIVSLQDHLGDLHDADVANTILSGFLFSRQDAAAGPIIAPGVVAYLAYKQRDLQRLVETFPQTWQAFNQPEVRRRLADAVAAL